MRTGKMWEANQIVKKMNYKNLSNHCTEEVEVMLIIKGNCLASAIRKFQKCISQCFSDSLPFTT